MPIRHCRACLTEIEEPTIVELIVGYRICPECGREESICKPERKRAAAKFMSRIENIESLLTRK